MNLPHAIVLLGASLLVFAACGDDGPGDPPPTATATTPPSASETADADTPTPGPTATSTATPTAVPADQELVRQLTRSASYIIYTASEGDTLAHVAYMFGGVPGREGTLVAFLAELQELNDLESGDLEAGQTVAVPLIPASTGESVFSPGGLWLWLTVGGVKELELYWPSDRLVNDGYQGALAAQAVELFLEDGSEDVVGYSIQFVETDRPVFKGGDLDPAAVVAGRAFDVHCGPQRVLIDSLPSDSVHALGDCSVVVPRGELDAQTIAGQLILVQTFVD